MKKLDEAKAADAGISAFHDVECRRLAVVRDKL